MLNVEFKNQPKGRYLVRIVSERGVTVQEFLVDHPGGYVTKQIAVSQALVGGVYQLQVIGEKSKSSIKLIITKPLN